MPNIKTYRQRQFEKKIEDKATKIAKTVLIIIFVLSVIGNVYLWNENKYLENTIQYLEQPK